MPAEAKDDDPLGRSPGEFLWDDEYGYADFLRQQKAVQPAYNWAALFQQTPAPESGEFFKTEWLKEYRAHELPDRRTMQVYIASDFATKLGGGDYSVHLALGCDPQNDLWVLDMWRRQADTATAVDALLDMVQRWKPLVAVQEKGQLANALGPFLRRQMNEREVWFASETFAARAEKSVRAQSIRGMMAVRGLRVPADASWYHDFRSEVLQFPVAPHDDIADCLGLCGQILDRMSKGSPLPQKTPQKIVSTDPSICSVTLTDLFEACERRHKRSERIS